jgi:hypothetical protein
MIATDGKPLTDEMLEQMVADLRSMGIVPPEMTKKQARDRLREKNTACVQT